MTRYLVLGGSGIVWAVMMFTLVRREVVPYFDYQTPPSYRDVLRDLRLAELTKGEIQAAGMPVGRIETMSERIPDGTVRIRTWADMNARILGTGKQATDNVPIKLKSESVVDALYRLSSLWSEIDVGFGVATVDGVREGDFLNVKFSLGTGKKTFGAVSQKVEVPKEGMMGDLFQPFSGGGSLFVGKKWKIPTMTADVTGARLSWLYASVTDREEILWRDEKVQTMRVEIRTEPTEEKRPTHISWCRSDGIAVKQQFTFQSLVYEIVFVSREEQSRGQAIRWGQDRFGPRP